jgi:hypothetical protein
MRISISGKGIHRREVPGVEKLRTLPAEWYAFTNLELIQPGEMPRQLDVIIVLIDDRHDHAQHGAHRRDHVADPVDQVQEGAFGLGRRLPLHRLVNRGGSTKVLSGGDKGNKLDEAEHQQACGQNALAPASKV